MNIYCIQVRGQVDLEELNAMSPHQMMALRAVPAATTFTIRTDQAGMIGLLRHLHNLGIGILSIECQTETVKDGIE